LKLFLGFSERPSGSSTKTKNINRRKTEITGDRNSLFALLPSVEAFSGLFGAPERQQHQNQEYQQEETEITEDRNSLFDLLPSVEAF
jgi:hypothetical protein